jgi:cytochrome c oxidase subunit 2
MRLIARILVSGLAASLLLVVFFRTQALSIRAQEPKVQVVELTAKKYEFSPSPVHVRAGTKVQLKITATDHDHGVNIATVPDGAESGAAGGIVLTEPQNCWRLKKGVATTIEFVAEKPGTYTFKCCHFCGLGHRGMKGQIVVE